MKFDVVVSNPPYQSSGGTGTLIYDEFVNQAIQISNEIVFVHPSAWRKPQPFYAQMKQLKHTLFHEINLKYLNINDTQHGKKTFGVGTRYDWYWAKTNEPPQCQTTVIDETGEKHLIDLSEYPFLPNSHFDQVKRLLADDDEEKCYVICDSSYHSIRDYVSSNSTTKNVYPVLHSINKDGKRRWMYSSRNDLGHFGVSKVVFADKIGISDAIIDLEGQYGMTEHAIAIAVDNKEMAENVYSALISDEFQTVLRACSWSNFQISWHMFAYFKRDWYETFIL